MAISTEQSFNAAAKKIRRYAKEMDKVVPSGLRAIGEEIMTDVKASRPGRGVPRRFGHLAGTGTVTGGGKMARTGRLGDARVQLTFGGTAAPYALVQHENLNLRHSLGEARYLVRGMHRWKPGNSAAINALVQNSDRAIRAAARSG